MLPEYTDLVLATHIPHSEVDAFDGFHRLYIEANGGDGANILIQLDLVQNGGLAWKYWQGKY